MDNKKSYYAIIPASVRYCEGLPPAAKLLYGEITALSNEKGYCWANNHYFSKLYEVEKKTVSRWINMLIRKGFLRSEVAAEKGNDRKIFISDAYLRSDILEFRPGTLSPGMSIGYPQKSPYLSPEMSIGYPQKSPEGIPKIVLHNNTINSTVNNTVNKGAALDFLKEKFPVRYEAFLMQNKKQIKEWDKFQLYFNATAEQEKLEFDEGVLFGRLTKYSFSWIENQEKFSPKEEEEVKAVYLRKCN